MHIICPHCTTSYAIDLATLGVGGRTVRCSRCKEVWLARPADAAEFKTSAMADAWQVAPGDDSGQWDTHPRDDGPDHDDETPIVSSPSIAADWQTSVDDEVADRDREADWPSIARYDANQGDATQHSSSSIRN